MSIAEVIQKDLSQVESFLTDSEMLRTSYGIRTLETPSNPNRVVDYVSSKSLAVFRISASRFWTRNASHLSLATGRNNVTRTKWAIYEREKFQGLANDVKHFVDSLFDLVSISRESQVGEGIHAGAEKASHPEENSGYLQPRHQNSSRRAMGARPWMGEK